MYSNFPVFFLFLDDVLQQHTRSLPLTSHVNIPHRIANVIFDKPFFSLFGIVFMLRKGEALLTGWQLEYRLKHPERRAIDNGTVTAAILCRLLIGWFGIGQFCFGCCKSSQCLFYFFTIRICIRCLSVHKSKGNFIDQNSIC